MKAQEKMSNRIRKIVWLLAVIFLVTGMAWAQDHDLVIRTAPDVTSLSPTDWKSLDIKIGADFGGTSAPDIIQRGVGNKLYARFRINGVLDYTIPSGNIQVKFYYRDATVGSTPPALSHPSWKSIGSLNVTYISLSDGPFAITRTWPTDFPSVTDSENDKYITWTPLPNGDKFHIAAELVYPTGITDANTADNVAVSLYESQSGLLDIVLLMDESGSMGSYNYGGYDYIDHAISRASMFLASTPEAHRFCVVAFNSLYPGGYRDIWPIPAALQPATDPNKTAANTAIAALNPGNMTPLGQGLERAIEILTTPLDPDRKRVILLLSDGYENWGSPQACSGADPANPCIGGALLNQLQTNDIKVFTVALGTVADTQCLECLANQSGGQWYSSLTVGVTLAKILLDAQQAANSDDLYRADFGTSGEGDNSYSVFFEGKDNVLYFILAWDDLAANLKLVPKPPRTARRVRLDSEIFQGKGYYVVKVRNPEEGAWTYSVSGDDGKKYLAAVRSDHVAVRLSIDTIAEGKAGLPLHIRATLKNGKVPVTNARVTATIQLPVGPSLETILQKASQQFIHETGRLPGFPELRQEKPDISPRAAFIGKIGGNRLETLLETRTVTIPMRHDGKGIYTAVLKENFTTTAGEYNITVTCSGETFQRDFSQQVRVQPAEIDFEKSSAELVKVETLIMRERMSTWVLNVYARDRFGNAVTAPTLLKQVKTKVNGARPAAPTITLGTYQQKLNIYPGQSPELEVVKIDGRPIKIERR